MSSVDVFWVFIIEAVCLHLFVFGPIGAVMYANRNRSPMAGYLLGALPLGLLAVAFTKPLPPSATPPTTHTSKPTQAQVQPLRQTAPVNGADISGSAVQALSQLKQLADAKLITEEDYTRKKDDILARM